MSAYAIAHLRNPNPNPEVIDYLRRIQATLDPYAGRFLVHGATHEVLEGELPGAVVVIGFPTLKAARDWYDSAPYQEILPLRTNNVDSTAFLVEGVTPDHDSAALGDAMAKAATGG
ncbi:DUF1330 domain-containing protein [Frankia sp. AiPs1]|uniref:DUF1330 domain-containing protein n=1 Tax=Frankia sp. AiPa1 TaxID=573492 RepID=UPI00202B410E|nr:DUF1330 domain-containing protein [Frankia sp. AiPa1]MCL9762473.1 DUF1330 domain-containing protein [Frankia sp. AiPa1]